MPLPGLLPVKAERNIIQAMPYIDVVEHPVMHVNDEQRKCCLHVLVPPLQAALHKIRAVGFYHQPYWTLSL